MGGSGAMSMMISSVKYNRSLSKKQSIFKEGIFNNQIPVSGTEFNKQKFGQRSEHQIKLSKRSANQLVKKDLLRSLLLTLMIVSVLVFLIYYYIF